MPRKKAEPKKKIEIEFESTDTEPKVVAKQPKVPKVSYVGEVPVVLLDSRSIPSTLRLTSPKLGMMADHKRSRPACVKLKCLDCSGGSRVEIQNCQVFTCGLWPIRPFKNDQVRPVGCVPTVEEYTTLMQVKESKYDRTAAIAALATMRQNKKDSEEEDDDDDDEVFEPDMEVEFDG